MDTAGFQSWRKMQWDEARLSGNWGEGDPAARDSHELKKSFKDNRLKSLEKK